MSQLDQLLQKYEFENSHLSKAISTETDKQNIVNKQRKDVDKQTKDFEEKITNLREEFGKAKVYEIEKNRGIERLKNEAYILRDHRNTIRNRLGKQKENNKQIIINTEELIREGTEKLEKYLEKYETIPEAKKILEEREKRGDLKNKIETMKELFIVLKEKEKEIKSFVEKQHFQVFKLNRTIKTTLLECSQIRKSAKLQYLEFLENQKLRENKNKQKTTEGEIQQQKNINKYIQNKQMIISPPKQIQMTTKVQFLKENYSQKERSINEANNHQHLEEMDTSPTSTSTPKITPIHMPNIQLSPLVSLTPSNRSDTNIAQIQLTPKPATHAFIIPQLKTPNLPQTISTPLSIQKFKPPPIIEPQQIQIQPQPINIHPRDTILQTPVSSVYSTERHNTMEMSNHGQCEESEFRFGFMEEKSPKSSNPFGTLEFDQSIDRTDSGFVTNLFSNTGNGTNQFQEGDNPFSFVP